VSQPPEPTDEEMQAAMEEQLRRVRVEDVLLQTTVTLVNLGARRLGLAGDPEERDPEQARMAIDGARALVPLLPTEEGAPIREAMSQLQMAYAREAGGADPGAPGAGAPPVQAPPPPGAPPPPSGAPAPGESPDEARRRADEEAERAKARARIWTPGSR